MNGDYPRLQNELLARFGALGEGRPQVLREDGERVSCRGRRTGADGAHVLASTLDLVLFSARPRHRL